MLELRREEKSVLEIHKLQFTNEFGSKTKKIEVQAFFFGSSFCGLRGNDRREKRKSKVSNVSMQNFN